MGPNEQGSGSNKDDRLQGSANDLQATATELGIGTTAAGGDNAGNLAPAATGGSGRQAGGAGLGGDISEGTSGL